MNTTPTSGAANNTQSSSDNDRLRGAFAFLAFAAILFFMGVTRLGNTTLSENVRALFGVGGFTLIVIAAIGIIIYVSTRQHPAEETDTKPQG